MKTTAVVMTEIGRVEIRKINLREIAPDEVTEWERWILEPVCCIVNGIRLSMIEPEDRVVLIGCGYMGLLFIQGLPREFISKLIAVDINDRRLSLAKEFGADEVVNSNCSNPEKEITRILAGYADIVIEASGSPGTIDTAAEIVRLAGLISIFGWHLDRENLATGVWHKKGLRIINGTPALSRYISEDFRDAVRMCNKGGHFNQKKLITHRFNYTDAQAAFETAARGDKNYIKGVLLF